MAVNQAVDRLPVVRRRAGERRLYIWAAVLIPLITVVGFGRSYYLKFLFDGPPLPSLLVHVHGLVMSLWVLLFVAQVGFVAARRTDLHKRLGIAGAVLSGLVVVVGIATAIAAAARGASPGPPPLQFLIVPLGDVAVFAGLVGTALLFRRKLAIHKRLMLLAALNMLAPAIARIPLQAVQTGGPLAFFGLTDLVLIAFLAGDTIRNRRLHPALLWGTLIVIALQPLRLMFATTDTWMRFALWLVG